ncbi:acyl-CoA N-acyltransferase [Gautieria morchelliformis]|nr:acyl-CoA N-acyltransferase [Gautieria morchelliformis]
MEDVRAQTDHRHEEQRNTCEHRACNFALPIPIDGLESERVSLVPFEPLRHAPTFQAASAPHPTLYRYLPFGPFSTLEAFLAWYQTRIEEDVGSFLFAVYDKSAVCARSASDSSAHDYDDSNPDSNADLHQRPDPTDNADSHTLAGIIGYLNTNPQHATTELGYVIILPRFHGTYVARHAIGLLLRYALDLPAFSGIPERHRVSRIGGLGLRRVQYHANASNTRSVRVAERVGFVQEGVIRWHRVLGVEKEGKQGRVGEEARRHGAGEGVELRGSGWGPGRDSVLLAVCWDDWEGGVREHLDRVMYT